MLLFLIAITLILSFQADSSILTSLLLSKSLSLYMLYNI